MSGPVEGGAAASNGVGSSDIIRAMKQQHQQRAASPPSPQLHSPRSPRDRVRRGHSPLTVLINPPSLDDGASEPATAVSGGRGGVGGVDSLSLALAELRTTGGVAASFLEAHERANQGSHDATAAATAAAATVRDIRGGSGGSSGSRSDDDFLCVRPVAKRSSSLKSKKTPPGTPCQVKKAVRFADAFGLDLANVKHVLDPDNPPEIPPQATRDLELGDSDDSAESAAAIVDDDDERGRELAPPRGAQFSLRPAFSQPGHSAGFGARVMAQKVVLESAAFVPPAEVRGSVRVANLAFEKSVSLRATSDGWRSSEEVAAAYVADSSNGMTDQFAFCLSLPPHSLRQPGIGRVALCVAYRVGGQTYWDNNFGENYTFDCVAASAECARGPRF